MERIISPGRTAATERLEVCDSYLLGFNVSLTVVSVYAVIGPMSVGAIEFAGS